MPSSEAVIYTLPYRPQGPTQVTTSGGVTQAYSSFGVDHTTVGPDFDALGLLNGPRVVELEFRARYFECTQHDWKAFDFEGRATGGGRQSVTQPLIGGSVPEFYVPLDQRRPSAPYRIGRKIVTSFTWLLFGHGRFPQVRSTDPDTQDFATELVRASSLEVRMQQARNVGGACGTVGISWCFREGAPRVEVHHGKNIHVLEWADESERVPAHVTKLVIVTRQVPDPKTRKLVGKKFWSRQDWTCEADVVFKECEFTVENPAWEIDQEASYIHGDGCCHFVYVENVPDQDADTTDGLPDYAETYEQQDALDCINSVVVRGAKANLDPTLKLKMNREDVVGAVQKGSEHALVTGENGDAGYLELAGTSISSGMALVQSLRTQILETSEAVVPDPDQVAAAGLSSVALKMLYAPALGKTDLMRHQYGRAVVTILTQMAECARRLLPKRGAKTPDEQVVYEVELDEEGNEVASDPVEYHLELEPRVEEVLDEEGEPTGETRTVERHPGEGTIALEWGPYFKPTSDDISKEGTSLVGATGGKAAVSQRTAVERFANLLDRDATDEWKRVSVEREQAQSNETFFPPPGSDVPDGAAPEGAVPAPLPGGATQVLELTPTTMEKITSVNEGRASFGKPPLKLPDGRPDPDGFLMITIYDAKMQALMQAQANVQQKAGEAQVEQQNEPPPPPAPAPAQGGVSGEPPVDVG